MTTIRVWDPLVRIAHWTLATTIAVAWFTRHGEGAWHEWAGYVALTVMFVRCVWGVIGTPYARFGQFIRSPAACWRYLRQILTGHEPRHIGHNPLGACMILALLITVAATGFTGWLYTTDAYWGVEWVEQLHAVLADALLVLIALHVGGVVFSAVRHRENLVSAMLHGHKRAAEPGDHV